MDLPIASVSVRNELARGLEDIPRKRNSRFGGFMKYFAYGSNMSLLRLRDRAPSALRIGTFILDGHDLRFHKASKDGSGKCDAYKSGNTRDKVIGALFEMDESEKEDLDRVEGLGYEYDEKIVKVYNNEGAYFEATTYFAIGTDITLKPYSWYVNHVVVGAKEIDIPKAYLSKIQRIQSIEDPDTQRDAKERAIHN